MPALEHFRDHAVSHPYLGVLPEAEFKWGWSQGENVVLHLQGERPFVIALGNDEQVIEALLEKAREVVPHSRIALQRKFEAILDKPEFEEEKSRWDWMAIFSGAQRYFPTIDVIDLGRSNDERIRQFLAVASPTASTEPGSSEVLTWHGVEHEGRLIAVGAAIRWSSGAAVLASIATAPEMRGKGLATEVAASLTSSLFGAGEERVSLGLYAENLAARRAYEKVGYELLEEFTSTGR